MPETAQASKNRVTLLLCGLLLTLSALTFATVGDAPQVLYMTVGGILVSLFVRRPIRRSTRTYVYSGVLVAAMTVIQNQVFTVDTTRFFLLPAEIYVPALLFLGVILTFFDQRETTLAAIAGAALLAMMISGNTLGLFEPNNRFTAANVLLDNLHIYYAIASFVQVAALLALLVRSDPRKYQGHEPRRYLARRTGTVGTAALITLALAAGLGWVIMTNGDRIQQFLRNVMQRHMRNRSQQIIFPQEADLWRTVPLKSSNDRTIILRVKAGQTPGYLRGRIYEYYANGRWTFLNERDVLPAEFPEGNVTYTIFSRPGYPAPDNAPRIDVFAQRLRRSDVIFAPGAAAEFELVAEDLYTDSNGALTANEWDNTGGYTILTRPYNLTSAFPRPGPAEMQENRFLGIASDLQTDLAALASEIFAETQAEGTRAKIRVLESYFAQNFTYRLGVRPRGRSQDPILQFLLARKSGHCELFATGAALLLRTQNIRTRYVTGFVCVEKNPFGNYWLSRLEDAHAWVEAFIPEENKWMVVETTPPAGIPGSLSRFNWVAALFDQLGLYWKDLIAQLKRGYAADILIRAFLAVVRWIAWVVIDPLRLLLIFVIATGFYLRQRQKRLAAARERDRHLPETVRQLKTVFATIEAHLRKHELQREAGTTLREFASRIREETGAEPRQTIAELLLEYEKMRYPATPPAAAAVAAFAEKVKRALKQSGNLPPTPK